MKHDHFWHFEKHRQQSLKLGFSEEAIVLKSGEIATVSKNTKKTLIINSVDYLEECDYCDATLFRLTTVYGMKFFGVVFHY